MSAVGKGLVIFGAVIVVVGLLLWGGSRLGIPFGRLPGDIHIRGENSSFHFPVVTCILASVVLTLLLNLLLRLFR